MLGEHLRTMARYGAWANRVLHDRAAGLSEAAYRQARPAAFFTSIHGTLNHLLLVDRLWFGRLAGTPAEGIDRLDQILYDDLPALTAARQAEDERIVRLVDGLDAAGLAATCHYTDTQGNPGSLPAWQILTTVFNHQTHHRGQAHALLKDAGADPPSLDLPVYLRSVA